MKIIAIQFHHGANIYAGAPVMALSVAGFGSAGLDDAALRQRLSAPPIEIDLGEETSWPTVPGGQSAPPVTWIARLALFLQSQAGALVEFHTVDFSNGDEAKAVFAYEDKTCAQEAGWLAFALIAWFLTEPGPPTQALAERLKTFREHAPRRAANMYTLPMIQAARDRDIPWSRLPSPNYYRLGYGSNQQVILESGAEVNNWIASNIARNKSLTTLQLAAQGLPVPRQFTVNSAELAVQAAREIGYPVVVKPPNMNQGTGVHLNLENDAQVVSAFMEARQYSPTILVEQYVAGRDYRLLVVGGELVAAAWRRPPEVTGDGEHSILALIAALNQDPIRADDNRAPLSKVQVDDEMTRNLAEQGLTLEDVPAFGCIVPLRRVPSVSLGGEPLDQLDIIHPDNRRIATDAAASLGLAIAGVDFLCPDISRSFTDVGGAICEVNAIPGLNAHFDMPGGMTAVAGKIVDLILPDPGRARIPIVVAPGQAGLIRQLAEACSARGHRPGIWSGSAARIDNRILGDPGAPQIADLLHSPLVDVACLAPEPDSLVDVGLGFDRASWAVLLDPGLPPAAAALLARYCERILLPENAAVPGDWPGEVRARITRLPAASDPASWLAQQVDQAINA